MIDLALYEIGNVLVRALSWDPVDVADQFDDLMAIVGPPLIISPAWLDRAAVMANQHNLSFYDASWAAASAELKVPLVSADRKLPGAGLAETPTQACARLQLSPR